MVPEATATTGDTVNDDRLRVADSDGRGDHCGELYQLAERKGVFSVRVCSFV
jgi:hypothetical protein